MPPEPVTPPPEPPPAAPPTPSLATPPPVEPPPDPGTPPPEPPPVEPGKWPEDWRHQLAGDDEKEGKFLDRYASPSALHKAHLELRNKMSSGDFVKPLPDDATEADIAVWRKENGLPEKFEGYYASLGDLVIGDADKPIFDDFFENVAHKINLKPEDAKSVAEWYYQLNEARQEEQAEFDNQGKKAAEDVLRQDWGKEYRININMMQNLLSRVPEAVKTPFVNSRLPDGTALFNSPPFVAWLVGLEREINPSSTLVPAGVDPAKGLTDRIAEIEKVMQNNRTAYNKDEGMQTELRKLYAARDKMKDQAA